MISSINNDSSPARAISAVQSAPPKMPQPSAAQNNPELRKAFDKFVGETFFGQLLRSMRKTVGKPAYFHGGRAEEIFQQQLDQVLVEKVTQSSADKFSGPMFELFTLQRK